MAGRSPAGVGRDHPAVGCSHRRASDTDAQRTYVTSVLSVAFSPDGSTLASGGGDFRTAVGTIRLWDARTGEHKQKLEGTRIPSTSVAFSPDGGTLASGSWDETIRLWNAVTGEQMQTLKGLKDPVLSVAFSPDGETLVSMRTYRQHNPVMGCGSQAGT